MHNKYGNNMLYNHTNNRVGSAHSGNYGVIFSAYSSLS